jgi:hypothetical protein
LQNHLVSAQAIRAAVAGFNKMEKKPAYLCEREIFWGIQPVFSGSGTVARNARDYGAQKTWKA